MRLAGVSFESAINQQAQRNETKRNATQQNEPNNDGSTTCYTNGFATCVVLQDSAAGANYGALCRGSAAAAKSGAAGLARAAGAATAAAAAAALAAVLLA